MFLLVFLPLLEHREDESDESGYFAKTDPLFLGVKVTKSSL